MGKAEAGRLGLGASGQQGESVKAAPQNTGETTAYPKTFPRGQEALERQMGSGGPWWGGGSGTDSVPTGGRFKIPEG